MKAVPAGLLPLLEPLLPVVLLWGRLDLDLGCGLFLLLLELGGCGLLEVALDLGLGLLGLPLPPLLALLLSFFDVGWKRE